MKESRTMVVISGREDGILAKILLTYDQMRLFRYLQDNNYFDEYYDFKILDDEVEPEII